MVLEQSKFNMYIYIYLIVSKPKKELFVFVFCLGVLFPIRTFLFDNYWFELNRRNHWLRCRKLLKREALLSFQVINIHRIHTYSEMSVLFRSSNKLFSSLYVNLTLYVVKGASSRSFPCLSLLSLSYLSPIEMNG